MYKLNVGRDLYLKGRIGWRGLSKDEYLAESEFRIINATALMDGYVDWENCGFISEERYEESPEIMLQEGDILISKDGTLGKIGYVKNLPFKCTVASGIFVLRNTIPELLNFDYLYHVLKSHIFKDFISKNKAMGSTINHLYQEDLEQFELELPIISEQDKIAAVLNTFDDKIDVNKEICNNIEHLLSLLYDYWFVQFDFPDEEGKPYRENGGNMKADQDLHCEIPDRFHTIDIKSIASVIDCLHSKKPAYCFEDESCYLLSLENLNSDGYVDTRDKFYISKEDYEVWSSKITLQKGDFVVTNAGRAGYIARVPEGVNCAIGRNITAIRPTTVDSCYFRQFFKSCYFRNQVSTNLDSGSFFMSFNVCSIKSLKILVPDEDTLKRFLDLSRPLVEEIETRQSENSDLYGLKNTLLPMLMTGQVVA
ncbi:restriction endonuclease subunit S [Eubacterium sp.]|uniref:restriction endonuclease subunit S n=1 Tax=Eubacterium sp. TaxID=142586 RepID=UPI0025839648|nr:restriction endonuclease subunit S [Eubacterium sp.]MCR5367656.1 restriction endonuclease subunit S [Eubacterium sp.]